MRSRITTGQKRGGMVLLLILGVTVGIHLRNQSRDAALPDAPPAKVETASTPAPKPPVPRIELNSADSAALTSVQGIGPVTARRIVRYRELIGGYQDVEQLLKVYGLSKENFVRIEEQVYADTSNAAYAEYQAALSKQNHRPARPRRNHYPEIKATSSYPTSHSFPEKKQANRRPTPPPLQIIDVNTADSATLVQVRGIGPTTARRILKFRNGLGYFHSVAQVGETWGITPENFALMQKQLSIGERFDHFPHIEINAYDIDQLAKHPYLKYHHARIITAYRKEHGPFASLDDLRNIQAIEEELWKQLEPYLKF